jgi:CP family cyanate transporter-like MFS transporter
VNSPSENVLPTRRALAWWGVAGVLILALGARSGVAALSPIAAEVEIDRPLTGLSLALIGAIPPVAYAVASLFTASLARRLSLEGLAIIVSALTGLAHIGRGLSSDFWGLFGATVVLMLGVGMVNVVLPGLVKLYAPRHIGQVTSAYSTMMAVSTTVPPATALWLANEFSWRISLGSWSLISFAAIVPLLVVLPLGWRRARFEQAALRELPTSQQIVGLGHSATARAIMFTFAISGLTAYSAFGILPDVLTEHAGISVGYAAVALTVFSVMGVPMSLVIPLLAVRPSWPPRLVFIAGFGGAIGFLGLAFAPAIAPLLWAVLTGLNTLSFSMALALIGARTQHHQMATRLSGYVNTVGYVLASAGPFVAGALHEITGTWIYSMLVLAALCLTVVTTAGTLGARRSVEEELDAYRAETEPGAKR